MEIDPQDADIWYEKAYCYVLLEKYNNVIETLKTALEFNQSLVYQAKSDYKFEAIFANQDYATLIILFEGVDKIINEEYQEGIAQIDEALSLNPKFEKYFVAINTKANGLMGLEKFDEALVFFDKALEHPADSFDSYTGWQNKGFTFTALERYEEAIDAHDKAIEFYDQSEREGKAITEREALSPVWDDRGWALMSLERYDEGIQSFDQALKCFPEDGWVYYSKACCYALQNQIDSAFENLQRAVDLQPEVIEAAQNDPEFDDLRSNDRFQRIISS